MTVQFDPQKNNGARSLRELAATAIGTAVALFLWLITRT